MLSIDPPTQPPVVVADRLRLAVGRLARRLRQQSLEGLTPSQRSVLASLDRLGTTTMSALAEAEGISPPSATGIVSRLADRGLVERRPHPDDGRCALAVLTDAGKDELERGRQERTAFLARQLDTLTDRERGILEDAVSILDRMVEAE